jgi:sarcosine oxidase subunit alpha
MMQLFARRIAGLGKIPDAALAPRKAERKELDALVVGSGPAGMMAALALAKKGRSVEVVDDAMELGGSALALDAFAPVLEAFRENVQSTYIRARRAVAAGIFGDDVLVAGEEGATIVHAKAVILAPGAHDGVLAFEGNDLPGIASARAGAMLARRGVTFGERGVVVTSGGGTWADALARHAKVEVIEGTPIAASGSSRVKGVTVKTKQGEKKIDCDSLFIDAPCAPAYELCAQAGAPLRHEPRGFVVTEGKIRDGFFAVGEVAGTTLELGAMESAVRTLIAGI